MKNFLIIILALLVLILGARLLTNGPPPSDPAAQPPSQVPASPEAPPPVIPAPVNTLTVTPLEPEPKSEADPGLKSDPDIKEANELIGALVEENQDLKQKAQAGPMGGIRQMLETEEGRKMMREQMKFSLNMTHAGLFKKLGLDTESENAIRDLLADQHMLGMESGLKLMAQDTAGRAQAAEEMKALHTEVHEEALKLLGEEKFAVFKDWQDTQMERQVLNQFTMGLGEDGLDDDTSDQLAHRMRDARKDFKELEQIGEPGEFNPFDMDEAQTANLVKQTETLHARYVKEAADLLDEEKLVKFEASLKQQRNMMEMGLKMQKAMFQAKPPESAPE